MFKKLSSKLEKMFDQPSEVASHVENKPTTATVLKTDEFQITENNKLLENISYIFSGDQITEKDLPLLFSHLSSFFEGGFLFEKKQTNGVAILTQAFWAGKSISCKQLPQRTLHLPRTSAFKVLKTPTKTLMRHFGLDLGQNYNDSGLISYLIPLNDRYSIAVTTILAEPWARLRIELLQKTLMKINFPT
ncbi:hypothetical protein [Pseudobdellovibrio exovorus]|uniref:Uncharacterized protein n=1 Tax=Pseudobdellovibrio exovorus JSS TaxID=1184267 RepID=M4V9E6_9BACT|nr:hypothetical protein [Pseudobdellovibrio exovorus]AGH95065.1 hypothetical protein A11Q_847 [Pseudobdellovibrio exovorus JSS]